MRKKAVLFIILIFLNSIMASGCWNYREIDKVAVVAGVAVDKGIEDALSLTVEIVEFSGEKEMKTKSRTLTVEGKTFFDAARNGIAFQGKRLYWSHAKAIIISEQVAREGMVKILDWINRDSETRADVNVFVAKTHTAKEIFQSKNKENEIISFELREMINNQRSLSKAPTKELWEVTNELAAKGIVATIPSIDIKAANGSAIPYVSGTSIFSKDKLIGYLPGEETKDMLFVKNKVKGGLLVYIAAEDKSTTPVSLEIFQSKTKIVPVKEGTNFRFSVNVDTTVAVDEIGGTENVIEESKKKELEKEVARILKARMERVIKMAQDEYGVDIFGFGKKLNEEKPKEWKLVKDNWNESFKKAKVNVNVRVHIRNSAMLSKPLEIGD